MIRCETPNLPYLACNHLKQILFFQGVLNECSGSTFGPRSSGWEPLTYSNLEMCHNYSFLSYFRFSRLSVFHCQKSTQIFVNMLLCSWYLTPCPWHKYGITKILIIIFAIIICSSKCYKVIQLFWVTCFIAGLYNTDWTLIRHIMVYIDRVRLYDNGTWTVYICSHMLVLDKTCE